MFKSISLKMNSINKIIKDHHLEKDGRINRFLRDEVDRFCDPYIPMKKGVLKNNKRYPSNHEITYTSPYAHYMYTGLKAVGASKPKGVKRTISGVSLHYKGAPKRGSKWDKRMWNDRKGDIIRDLEKEIRRG